MARLVTRLGSLVREVEGQDLLEYALLVALIAIVAIGAVTLAGERVDAIFTQVANAI
jgi:pilus assembly protein Flp/PilA